jgi:hypothetical protein
VFCLRDAAEASRVAVATGASMITKVHVPRRYLRPDYAHLEPPPACR